jgi:hypothetical protein
MRDLMKGFAIARHSASDIDTPKSADFTSCSVGADEQPESAAAKTTVYTGFIMTPC